MGNPLNHARAQRGLAVRSGTRDHLRFLQPHLHLARPFGSDWFGRKAEAFARVFGTPAFLITQTVVVATWIGVNAAWAAFRWDPYPFILLNLAFSLQAAYAAPLILLSLAFSLQAAYAAPLILLAQTRQADRDKALAIADAEQRDAIARDAVAREEAAAAQAEELRLLLESNTALTLELERLTREIHGHLVREDTGSAGAARE